MGYRFKPCVNRSACTEDGTHCRSCGRSHEEINTIRNLSSEISRFMQDMQYENPDDFLDYLQRKIRKKLNTTQ